MVVGHNLSGIINISEGHETETKSFISSGMSMSATDDIGYTLITLILLQQNFIFFIISMYTMKKMFG